MYINDYAYDILIVVLTERSGKSEEQRRKARRRTRASKTSMRISALAGTNLTACAKQRHNSRCNCLS